MTRARGAPIVVPSNTTEGYRAMFEVILAIAALIAVMIIAFIISEALGWEQAEDVKMLNQMYGGEWYFDESRQLYRDRTTGREEDFK